MTAFFKKMEISDSIVKKYHLTPTSGSGRDAPETTEKAIQTIITTYETKGTQTNGQGTPTRESSGNIRIFK